MYQKKSCGWKDIGVCYYKLLVNEVNKVPKKNQANENNYFDKFQSEFGFDTTTSVTISVMTIKSTK